MEFRGIVRRVAGASAVVAATATMLLGGVSGAATAATGANEVGVAAAPINIKHASTRKCLDSNVNGAVYTHTCEGRANLYQQWDNYAPGKFRNVATKRCLATNGSQVTTVRAQDCDNPDTNWTTTPGSPKLFRSVPHAICMHNAGADGQGVGQAACESATRWSTVAPSTS